MQHFSTNISKLLFILLICSCNSKVNIEEENAINDSLKFVRLVDSLITYSREISISDSERNRNQTKLDSLSEFYKICPKSVIGKRDSVILATRLIFREICPIVRWVGNVLGKDDSNIYVRIPLFDGGIDSIQKLLQLNLNPEFAIPQEYFEKSNEYKVICKFEVNAKANNIQVIPADSSQIAYIPVIQEVSRLFHILPCWSSFTNGIATAEEKKLHFPFIRIKKYVYLISFKRDGNVTLNDISPSNE